MAIYDDSRYTQTSIIPKSGYDTQILRIRERVKFREEGSTLYQWKPLDTLDGVAYNFYENTNLRWAILDANPQYRTEFDIKVGDYLVIPDYEEVVDFLNV